MKKEKLVEKLRESAVETARSAKRIKQCLFIIIPLFMVVIIVYFLGFFDIIPFKIFEWMLIPFLTIMFSCYFFLPLGKVSEEKVNKYFQEKLSSKIKDVQAELDDVNTKKPKLEEELKLLNEI